MTVPGSLESRKRGVSRELVESDGGLKEVLVRRLVSGSDNE